MALGPQTGDGISPVPVSIGERLWGIPWGIPDLWIFPTVFHTPINGLVARPYRAWSRGRVGSRDRIRSCDWSRGTKASKGSRDEARDRFPGSRARWLSLVGIEPGTSRYRLPFIAGARAIAPGSRA